MGRGSGAISAPRRSHSQPRRDCSRLRQAGKGRPHSGRRGARQGDANQGRRLLAHRPDKIKQFQDAQAQLSGALGRLLAVSEAYPDLKSNANFLALQSQLEGTENRINVARRDYIGAARDFNLALRTFPTVLWAKTFFSSEKPLAEFTASDAAQGAPQVKF